MYEKSSSPYIRTKMNVENIMYEVILSLLPILIFSIYTFGHRVLIHFLIVNTAGFLAEYIYSKILKKTNDSLDGSTFVTCTLLIFTLPHTLPYYISIIGGITAIILGKMVWGGVGKNIFNPALLARFVLSIFFPYEIYRYVSIDGNAGATLIPLIKYQSFATISEYYGGFWGIFNKTFFGIAESGSMGETSFFLIFLALIFLAIRKHILLRVPLLILLTVFIGGIIFGHNPYIYITYGGIMFAAVFMATDMVTSPYTKTGLIVYSIMIGTLTVFIREFTAHQEGVTIAILIVNIFVPLLNSFFQQKVYGKKNKIEIKGLILIILFPIIILFYYKIIDKEREPAKNKVEKIKKEIAGDKKIGEDIIKKGNYEFIPLYENGEIDSYIVYTSTKGHSKAMIYYMIHIDEKGKINKLKIIKHRETIGLGAKISNTDWQNMWIGRDKNYEFETKTDAFAGATFTSYNLYKSIKDVLDKIKSEDEYDESGEIILETWD